MSNDYGFLREPDWTNRRRAVFCALRFDHGAAGVLVAASLALAWFDKFDGWIATFCLTCFIICLGRSAIVIGSYVFGAAWENRNFMALVRATRGGEGETKDAGAQ